LREFIENVDVAFEFVHPNKYDILLKFVKTNITGDARSKLIVRDLTHTWALVNGVLETIMPCDVRWIFMHAECLVPDRKRARIPPPGEAALMRCRQN